MGRWDHCAECVRSKQPQICPICKERYCLGHRPKCCPGCGKTYCAQHWPNTVELEIRRVATEAADWFGPLGYTPYPHTGVPKAGL